MKKEKKKKNQIKTSKIEWCSHVWNPWVGCLAGCHYCYARRIVKNFISRQYGKTESSANIKKKLKNFEPVFIPSQFSLDFPDNPAVIFINPLSDVRYWFPRVMNNSLPQGLSTLKNILQKIEAHPQHIFVALTKFYQTFDVWIEKTKVPENLILGLTYTKYDSLNKIEILVSKTDLYKSNGYRVLWNFEPGNFEMLQTLVDLPKDCRRDWSEMGNKKPDWIIFGLQTPSRRTITIKEYTGLQENIELFLKIGIPIFTKGIKYPGFPPVGNSAPHDIFFILKEWGK